MSNATNTTYFTIFLQIIDITNFYWFSSNLITDITLLLTNFASLHVNKGYNCKFLIP